MDLCDQLQILEANHGGRVSGPKGVSMEFAEALFYVIGFFLIWGGVTALFWGFDNFIIKPIFKRTLIKPEFWQ